VTVNVIGNILGGGGGGSTPTTVGPTITVAPVEGSVISRATSLTVTVATTGSLRRVVISALYGGSVVEEVVHNGVAFASSYTGGSNARVVLGNGFQFTILKLGGWRGSSVTLRVVAIDTSGNIAQKTVGSPEVLYTWQVDDSMNNVTPFLGSRF